MSRRPVERGSEISRAPDGRLRTSVDNPRPSLEYTSKAIPRAFAAVRASFEVDEERHVEIAKAPKDRKKKLSRKEKKKMREAKMEDLKKELSMDEHKIPLEELGARYSSRLNAAEPAMSEGMSGAAAAARLEENGPNELSPPPQRPEWLKFLDQFTGFFSLLLEVGGLLCFLSYILDSDQMENLYLGVVLWIVVIITGIFTYSQEHKASKVAEGFKKLAPSMSTVVRDGKKLTINARELVVGDVVVVKGGDKIPADMRVIACNGLKVDNSSLTGESDAISKSVEFTHENPLETKNLAFFGTLAVDGEATGVIVNCGDDTVIGRIASLATATENVETPIHREIVHFIHIISAIAISLGVSFFIISLANGFDFITTIVFLISIIVANVPEGLLATVTVSLTLTAKRMATKAVLVKNLESVETLGSTSCICSDKTGTLTQNRMTVAHVWYDSAIHSSDITETHSRYSKESESFKALHRVGVLCSRADFDQSPENMALELRDRKVVGDATEAGILKFCEPVRSVTEYRKAYPKVFEIPFNSTNKWQLSIHKTEDKNDNRRLVVLKGAPERVLGMCTHYLQDGKEHEMTDEWRNTYNEAYETLGSFGERVLGFAHYYLPEDKFPATFDTKYDADSMNFPHDKFVFVGLKALIDPPRPGVPEAVKTCQFAGIRVVMVTGDHPITAEAIARQVNIITGETDLDIAKREGINAEDVAPGRADAIVVPGWKLVDYTEADWDRVIAHKEVVFARTSPQQKLVIVEHFQKAGNVVAVTGDGVNDSPALKKADIGVAMGIAGSDVSKEAADMILMDDNFASIVNGVEEGRLIFDNLKKSISYTLSSNIPEIAPFLVFIIMGIPLPLSTILILFIDLGTDMIPAISLAYEEAESDIMYRPPRNSATDKLVNKRLISFAYFQIGIMQALAGFFVYLVVFGDAGFPAWSLPNLGRDAFTGLDDSNYLSAQSYCDDVACRNYGPDAQEDVLRTAQTAYFVSIVLVQWADLLICKTRKLSIVHQGMRNRVMNFGLFFETALAALVCYVPALHDSIGSRGIEFVFWLPALPFTALIFTYDECRKYFIRRNPNGWLERNTYW